MTNLVGTQDLQVLLLVRGDTMKSRFDAHKRLLYSSPFLLFFSTLFVVLLLLFFLYNFIVLWTFQITAKRMWKNIYDALGGNPGSTSAATYTRRHYEKQVTRLSFLCMWRQKICMTMFGFALRLRMRCGYGNIMHVRALVSVSLSLCQVADCGAKDGYYSPYEGL